MSKRSPQAVSLGHYTGEGESEQLYGGLCDGLVIKKTKARKMYGRLTGDGKIQVYTRRRDGRLKYSKTMYLRTPTYTWHITLNLAY